MKTVVAFVTNNNTTFILFGLLSYYLGVISAPIWRLRKKVVKPIFTPDDLYPNEFWHTESDVCRGCGTYLNPRDRRIADGCPCNSSRGINHGLVGKNTCTCEICDPLQTGCPRISVPPCKLTYKDKSGNNLK